MLLCINDFIQILLNIYEGVDGWTHAPLPQNPPMMSSTVISQYCASPSPGSFLLITLCKVLSTLHNLCITSYKVIWGVQSSKVTAFLIFVFILFCFFCLFVCFFKFCNTVGEYPPQIHVKPALDVQKMENVQTCLNFLEYCNVSVNDITAEGKKIWAFLSSKTLSVFVAFISVVCEFKSLPLQIRSYATIWEKVSFKKMISFMVQSVLGREMMVDDHWISICNSCQVFSYLL